MSPCNSRRLGRAVQGPGLLWGTCAQTLSTRGHTLRFLTNTPTDPSPRNEYACQQDTKNLHLEAAPPEAPRSRTHTEGARRGPPRCSARTPRTPCPQLSVPFHLRARRAPPEDVARPAQRWPIPSVHANEAPYRAAAPPPAARAVVTHSWGPCAAAARLRGARSHRLLSAPGLPLLFTTDPVGNFFFSFLNCSGGGGAGRVGDQEERERLGSHQSPPVSPRTGDASKLRSLSGGSAAAGRMRAT